MFQATDFRDPGVPQINRTCNLFYNMQDFAIVWDEDRDERIIWVVEHLIAMNLLFPVMAIGERKANVHLWLASPEAVAEGNPLIARYWLMSETRKFYDQLVQHLCESVPSDVFSAECYHGPENLGEYTSAYVEQLHKNWKLGRKPLQFREDPFDDTWG
jgi:hypothetical protein